MNFAFKTVPTDSSSVIRHHSRSFSWAARLLPPSWRRRTSALYAWCRWCDNSVDCANSLATADAQLTLLREDVQRMYANQHPHHDASQWLADVLCSCFIPQQLPLDLLHGMQMDVHFKSIETQDDLLDYCYHAAGSVGLMMAHVFGTTGPDALRSAKALGMAMQLTNIARDVQEDWQRGRCYLPSTWLKTADPSRLPTEAELTPALQRILELADGLYEEGIKGIDWLPRRVQPAILLASEVYRAIGEEIRRQGFRVLSRRTRVPTWRMMMLGAPPLVWALRLALVDKLQKLFRTSSFPWFRISTGTLMQTMPRYLVAWGLSLTLVMATALFVLVGINPKDEAFGHLPWLYASLSALAACVFGYVASRLEATARSMESAPQET